MSVCVSGACVYVYIRTVCAHQDRVYQEHVCVSGACVYVCMCVFVCICLCIRSMCIYVYVYQEHVSISGACVYLCVYCVYQDHV